MKISIEKERHSDEKWIIRLMVNERMNYLSGMTKRAIKADS